MKIAAALGEGWDLETICREAKDCMTKVRVLVQHDACVYEFAERPRQLALLILATSFGGAPFKFVA